ncbi:MAG: type I methionyl aminopeptidase [Armatimonadota bacterium]|jgi:methionyl aminopeptidase
MGEIQLKTPAEMARMREAGRLVAEVLRLVSDIAEPGLSTEQLDRAAVEHIESKGGVAAFKGYRGFPANICTSINEEIVHGIPGARRLRQGDLLKVDVGVIWDGYFADGAVTVPVGDVTEEARRLMQATRAALNAALAAVRAGVRVQDISATVQKTAESQGFSVVREYTGHGIGRALHEEPSVPNFVTRRLLGNSPVLDKGATVAVEPMLNAGTHKTRLLENGWTVVTRDGELSAHFEHTIAVDEDAPVVLTLP